MTVRGWCRLALCWPAAVSLQVGVWALLAPRSFYDDFPGLGRTWVSVDGPFNEHLVRDVGGLYLALASVTIGAAITMSRPLVIVACVAVLASGVPHLVYHATNTAALPASDAIASLVGLALSVVIPIALLVVVSRPHALRANGEG